MPQFRFIEEPLKYDGSQLKSLYAYLNHQILGDSIVAFTGPCDVSFEHMVDGEDFLEGSAIRGDSMLHFIIELFGRNLEQAVTFQRLFTLMVQEHIHQISPHKLTRSGDDLFLGDGKLSISIATVSPVSALIHFAMNMTNAGTPVKTASLMDLDISPRELARLVGKSFSDEVKTINEACWKVHWVK